MQAAQHGWQLGADQQEYHAFEDKLDELPYRVGVQLRADRPPG